MAEVTLKVLIAGRTYQLSVPKEQEPLVLQAAKLINEKVKEFEVNYSVRDKQDLLAMSALNLLTNPQTNTPKTNSSSTNDDELISQLNLFVSDYIQKESNVKG